MGLSGQKLGKYFMLSTNRSLFLSSTTVFLEIPTHPGEILNISDSRHRIE